METEREPVADDERDAVVLPLAEAVMDNDAESVVLPLSVALDVTLEDTDGDPVRDAVVEAVALSDSEVLTVSLVVAEPEPD